MIITDSRCKHVPKCCRNNSSEMGQWVPKHFHIIAPVVPVTHLEFICSGRLTPQQMLQNIGSSRRVTAEGSRVRTRSARAAKPSLHCRHQIFAALLKSSFSPWVLHQRQKKENARNCMLQVRLITGQSADRENLKALSLQPLISSKDCKFHCGGCTTGNPISPSV